MQSQSFYAYRVLPAVASEYGGYGYRLEKKRQRDNKREGERVQAWLRPPAKRIIEKRQIVNRANNNMSRCYDVRGLQSAENRDKLSK